MSGLFVEELGFCRKAGLEKLGDIELDSTKVQANISKHKGMSYEGMEMGIEQLEAGVLCLPAEAGCGDVKAQVIVYCFSWNRRIKPLDLAQR